MTAALYRHHLPLNGTSMLRSTARHTFDHALGSITEVFSGDLFTWPQEAVPHQGFSSAGVILPMIRGLAGLDGDALQKTVAFAPQFPADWEQVKAENFQIGQSVFDFEFRRSSGKIQILIQSSRAEGCTIRLSPALGPFAEIEKITVHGEEHTFETISSPQAVIPVWEIPASPEIETSVYFQPGFEILPPEPETPVGEPDHGLKIIALIRENNSLTLEVEGLAGREYCLKTRGSEHIAEIKGAELDAEKLFFQIPEGPRYSFLRRRIKIKVR